MWPGERDADGNASSRKCSRAFPAQNWIDWNVVIAWIDRPSLLMVGEHVTLGGEADAETELDVSEAREKKDDRQSGHRRVHTAPGHGHDDFVIGKRYGLEIYCPVDNAGRFTPEVEHFAGHERLRSEPEDR